MRWKRTDVYKRRFEVAAMTVDTMRKSGHASLLALISRR
jgi:hypothetical protein